MDRNRVLRWPGFRNCKHDPSNPITVKYPCDSTSNPASNPGDFRLDIPAANQRFRNREFIAKITT
jgi:hypothetical protein